MVTMSGNLEIRTEISSVMKLAKFMISSCMYVYMYVWGYVCMYVCGYVCTCLLKEGHSIRLRRLKWAFTCYWVSHQI